MASKQKIRATRRRNAVGQNAPSYPRGRYNRRQTDIGPLSRNRADELVTRVCEIFNAYAKFICADAGSSDEFYELHRHNDLLLRFTPKQRGIVRSACNEVRTCYLGRKPLLKVPVGRPDEGRTVPDGVSSSSRPGVVPDRDAGAEQRERVVDDIIRVQANQTRLR